MDLRSSLYEHAMARVLHALTERYAGHFSADEVATVFARCKDRLERSGRHCEFIPALTEHAVRDELTEVARSEGRPLTPLPKVLFVCEHGEGRSQVAAALAGHLSCRQVLVRSAGLHPTGRLNPHARTVLAERGIELGGPLPCEVQHDVLDAADVLVLIGCGDCDLTGHRTVRWDIDDPYARDLATARRIAAELEEKVRDLLDELEVPVRETAVTASAR